MKIKVGQYWWGVDEWLMGETSPRMVQIANVGDYGFKYKYTLIEDYFQELYPILILVNTMDEELFCRHFKLLVEDVEQEFMGI